MFDDNALMTGWLYILLNVNYILVIYYKQICVQ